MVEPRVISCGSVHWGTGAASGNIALADGVGFERAKMGLKTINNSKGALLTPPATPPSH